MVTDYTFDLETMGTNANAAILSIGAAAFDRNSAEFDLERTFYINIYLNSSLEAGLSVDASTIYWWLEQSTEARSSLLQQPIATLEEALLSFSDWVKMMGGSGIPAWSHATFDAPILGNAYRQLNMKLPTSYRAQRDIRTLVDLMGVYEIEARGTHHNALDDSIYQAEYIWGLLNGKGKRS